ncbi:MAG: deoxynucleoside kinase [Schleiferiaceae bacterium]|nr:deoxynucleoside kinase [Schleiferiaceae bacterium]
MKKVKHIAIEGNIGSGKTTTAKALAAHLGAHLYLESFEDNPHLEKFYKSETINPLKMEAHFLMERYFQIAEEMEKGAGLTISDYCFEKCLVFSEVNLDGNNKTIYQGLWQVLTDYLPQPDVIVYLAMEVPQLVKNIRKRGREMEMGLTASYLRLLQDSYGKQLSVGENSNSDLIIMDGSMLLGLSNKEIAEKLVVELEGRGWVLVDK